MAGANNIPENLRYTKDHEWVEMKGNRARIGITDYAQEALTDVVFVELPEVGEEFGEHDSMGVVESVKSVSDIFAPFAGKVVAVNSDLDESPELLNQDPYGKGWFCEMEVADPAAGDKLLDAAGYRKVLQGQ
ncbi:MAG TPA: glycine cleavage system protein GcvH [Candidatus Thermoplasmatota archaeon]|nr:glycine cleavage system protein GcvH [Candidatus Thermoplasmatota archaeon]